MTKMRTQTTKMKMRTTRTNKSIKVRIDEPSMSMILRVDTAPTALSLEDGTIKGEVGFVKGFTFHNYKGSLQGSLFRFRTKI